MSRSKWMLTSAVLACGARTNLNVGHQVADAAHDAPPVGDAGGPCTDLVLADGISPSNIVADGDYIYFTSDGAGIGRVPKAGGAIETYSSDASSYNVATDDTYVYWTSSGVFRALKSGGPVEQVMSLQQPFGLALDDAFVYVADNVNSVWRVPKAGGAALAVFTVGDEPIRVAVDGTDLFTAVWAGLAAGISQTKTDGNGPLPILLYPVENAYSVVVDAKSVFWTSQDLNTSGVREIARGGGNVIVHSKGGTPDGITVDDAYVYWGDLDGGVYKSPKGSTSVTTITSGDFFARAVAVDDRCLYYTTDCCIPNKGQIIRTPK